MFISFFPQLKFCCLFFYSLILTNSNLLLKIYCENIVVTFIDCDFLFCFLSFLVSLRFFFFFFLFYIIFPNLITSIRFFFFFLLAFSPPHTYPSSLFFLLFLFLLDFRTLSTVIRNREIKNKRLLAPPLIEGHRQALSLFCSGLLACSTVGQMASMSFFFLFFLLLLLWFD